MSNSLESSFFAFCNQCFFKDMLFAIPTSYTRNPSHLEKKGVTVAFANLTRDRSGEHDCGQKAQLTDNTAQCRVGFTYYLLALICTPFGQVAKLLKNQTKRGDTK